MPDDAREHMMLRSWVGGTATTKIAAAHRVPVTTVHEVLTRLCGLDRDRGRQVLADGDWAVAEGGLLRPWDPDNIYPQALAERFGPLDQLKSEQMITRQQPDAIRPIPMTYRGTKFRSTLEADWAATFDSLDWYWQYEPQAVYANGVPYLCDFYLPTMRVWCEVKGPHDERIEKAVALNQALGPDPWDVHEPLVVVLRAPGPGEVCVWENVGPLQDIAIATCSQCEHHSFIDYAGAWQCRRCYQGGKFWMPKYGVYWPGELHFTRAPRAQQKGRR